MKTAVHIDKLISKGFISNELDYERALVADRKLRLLSQEDSHFGELRMKLRALIEQYESNVWSDVNQIDEAKLSESKLSEQLAEKERFFMERRKSEIKKQLKKYDVTQEQLAKILGHKSKTHMSELINGIKPFTLKDLIILNRVLGIELSVLIPAFLPVNEQIRITETVQKLKKPQLHFQPEV
jgi:antitoxin component HigA of HigAB toxin-antitoxin module